jgi:phospholipase/carboxylesterase
MRLEKVGGLNTRLAGGTDGRGGGSGPAVVLLHGYGAPGDDLVVLADVLRSAAGTRWIFPEGPLPLNMGFGDSRAWWLIDMARLEADRAAGRIRDLSSEVPRGLAEAREALEKFVTLLPSAFAVDYRRTLIGGFSQGAMLTCDLVMRTAFPFAGLIQLSGSLLARQEWRPSVGRRTGLPVFQSHGTKDPILPYAMAERLRDELMTAGLAVEWHSFYGGHEIPAPVLSRLSGFVTKVLAKA